ncbi:MAG: SLBB domain-containing protein [Saprospiraceae bacterium]
MIYRYILLIFLSCASVVSYSQSINEAAARAELEKRGYDADRFKQEMIKKGVNPEAIDPNNPVDVARAKKAAEEVMTILDAEKKAKSTGDQPLATKNTPVTEPPSKTDNTRSVDDKGKLTNQTKDIQKAVKEGATIEEAVSEKLQEVAKEKLPPAQTYGQHIFRDKSLLLFRTAEDAKPTKAYVLGPGDRVAVSIWGTSTVNFASEIQKDGFIQPTDLPRIYISGLTLGKAEDQLYTYLRRYYYFTKENYELTVTTARTLNVNILGEVFNNGTFNVSSVNTAFNALIAAGGPNDIGSVRKIQLLRVGQKPKTLDVYQYLQNPISSQDYYLSENDYINVPVAEKLINISGAINRPFRYELLEKEHLMELIKFAGGLKPNALKGNLQVKRIENDSVRIIDVNFGDLEKNNKNFILINGDEVVIQQINENLKNEVNITGAVENPGIYALTNNDKISDLINKAVLQSNAVTDIAYLKRYNDDFKTIRYEFINISNIIRNPSSAENLILKKGDELTISSKASFSDNYEVSVEGAVRTPTKFKLDTDKNLKVSDALFFAGGLKSEAIKEFAYIFRVNQNDAKTQEYISLDLKKILSDPSSAANIGLEPRDRLVFYESGNYIDETFVTVAGAVRSPAEFLYHPSLTLKDALLLAGGVRQEADQDRIDVYRLQFENNKSVRVLVANLRIDSDYNIKGGGDNFSLQPFDQIFVRTAPEFELQRNIFVNGEVKYPGTYALMIDNTRLSSIINDAGGPTQEAFLKGATLVRGKENIGFVIIDLEKAIKNPQSYEDIILQDGDEISIPKINNIVSITGATKAYELYPDKILNQNKIQVPYRSGKSAKYYIDEYAGGLAKNASYSKISVIDASGKVTKAKNFLFFRSYPKVGPGAEVRIGFKDTKPVNEKGGEKEDVKWGDILANSIAQATAILSIILLIQNVN